MAILFARIVVHTFLFVYVFFGQRGGNITIIYLLLKALWSKLILRVLLSKIFYDIKAQTYSI